MGLRAEEAAKACKSLKKWEKLLLNDEPVHIIYGTKGGCQRYIYPTTGKKRYRLSGTPSPLPKPERTNDL
ncbi:integrase domain-containing protein [Saezia sanguinis]|uniref:integrase domain-containing protein n=1 Tax=Saezia sanguinis TaxID=1965230 RepID=UPI000F8D163D